MPWLWMLALALAAPGDEPRGGGGGSAAGLGGLGSLGTRAPLPPLPPLAEDRVLARLGQAAFTAAGSWRHVAGGPGGLLAGGEGGVSLFAADGSLIQRLGKGRVSAVAWTSDGRPAWVGGEAGSALHVGTEVWRVPDSYRVEDTLAPLADGRVAVIGQDEVQVLAGDREVVARWPAGDRTVLVASPKGDELLVMPEYYRASLGGVRLATRTGKVVGTLEGAPEVAWGAGLALGDAAGLTVDGAKVKLPEGTVHGLAWAPDGRLAVGVGERLVVLDAKRKVLCDLRSPAVSSGLTWLGDTVFLGSFEGSSPQRLDATTCEAVRSAHDRPIAQVVVQGDRIATHDGRSVALWARATGDLVGRVDVEPTDVVRFDGESLLLAKGGRTRPHTRVASRSLETTDLDGDPGMEPLRMMALDLDGGYHPPSEPQVALGADGTVAAGLEHLTVRHPDGHETVYDLTDQVHLDLRQPSSWGGLGYDGERRQVRSSWDPSAVRPEGLRLTALSIDDRGRVWMGWEFQVEDPYGERHVDQWIGALDPRSGGLAGWPTHGRVEAIHAVGDVVAWMSDHSLRVGRLPAPVVPPEPEPEPEPEAPRSSDLAREVDRQIVESAGLLGLLGEMSLSDGPFGDLDDGGISGLGGPSGHSSAPPHRGLAQRVDLVDELALRGARGRLRNMALSADGSRVAAVSDAAVAVWSLDQAEPRLLFDVGGAVALTFEGETLWVAGADGRLTAVRVD